MEQYKALLENSILTDDVKKQLTEALTEITEQAKKDLEVDFAKRFEKDKISINEELSKFVAEAVSSEIADLVSDLAHYRNLEVEYASRLEVFKESYAKELNESVRSFITESVSQEVTELKESIVEAKSLQFGKRIFEAFEKEFTTHGFGGSLKEVQDKLSATESALVETKAQISEMERERIMEGLLSNLSGSKRNIMKTVLENVLTEKLVARYEESLKSILSEDVGNVDNKIKPILEEKNVVENAQNTERLNRLRRLSGGKV